MEKKKSEEGQRNRGIGARDGEGGDEEGLKKGGTVKRDRRMEEGEG